MVVAPCDAGEGGSRFVGGLVNDGDAAFGMFAAEFGDEGEVAGAIDVGLDLGSELWEGKSCGVAGVVVAVGDYVDDDIEKVGSVVAVVEGVGVVWCQWWMGRGVARVKARVLKEATVLEKGQEVGPPWRTPHSMRMRTMP